jgi:general secretion pathway protein I
MRPRAPGFTLVEVMVALAVVAVALPALLFTLYQQIDGIGYIRDRSLAQMVAANKMTEYRLISRARSSLLVGADSGVAELADREWYWRVTTEATEVPEFYRVEVLVGLDEALDERQLSRLTAFMSADLAQDPDPIAEDPVDEGNDSDDGDDGSSEPVDDGANDNGPDAPTPAEDSPTQENLSDVD